MKFVSALTTNLDIDAAIPDLVAQITGRLTQPINLVLALLSPHFRSSAMTVVERLRAELDSTITLGCTAEGVISHNKEIEHQPAISVIAAHMPDVTLTPFSLQAMSWDKLLADTDNLQQTIGVPADTKLFVMLADPFTTPTDEVLSAFNTLYPGVPIIGGLASGSMRAGGNAIFLNDHVTNNGAIGVAFSGAVDVDVVVSQGCRPIGEPLQVTTARENVIFSLEGEPPMLHLQRLWHNLPEDDQELLKSGVYIGRAIDPDRETLGRGDFLIRGVMGIDQETGAMVVGDYIKNDETIQFHVRDAGTAAEDLEMMLTPQQLYGMPSGGFLFSCNGRGTRLYPHPDGDISTIQQVIGGVDIAGFFCAGEIGPIGGKNFLHGHTASLVLFRPTVGEYEVGSMK